MASDEFDPVVRRRKSRDLRRSRDISDESSDRDTRRRSSTDGALLGAEAPRLLPGISNMRLVGLSCLVFMPYTLLLVLTLNIPKEQRSAALENTVVGVGLLLLLTAMGTVAAAILARSRS